MEFGIGYFATHDGVDPGAFARLVEQRGHESLFFPEHTHIPASRETPYPAGGELPHKYFHSYDLFVALSTAAAVTSGWRRNNRMAKLRSRKAASRPSKKSRRMSSI